MTNFSPETQSVEIKTSSQQHVILRNLSRPGLNHLNLVSHFTSHPHRRQHQRVHVQHQRRQPLRGQVHQDRQHRQDRLQLGRNQSHRVNNTLRPSSSSKIYKSKEINFGPILPLKYACYKIIEIFCV